MNFSAAPDAGLAPRSDLASRAAAAFDLLAATCDGHLGLAVSGGSDSLALLHLARDWANRTGVSLHVATVDHGLRREAAVEADQVARICRRLGADHAVLRWRPAGAVSQQDARLARHSLLAGWARDRALPTLALGHTADDRIETFLIRARAGSGWWGLAAPLPASASPADPRLRLIRPLLAFARADLRQHLTARGESWIDDPSNDAPKFERVRMRALISRLDPGVRAACLRIADRFARMRSAAMAEARAILADASRVSAGECLVQLSALRTASATARLRLIEALVLAAAPRVTPPPLAPLERIAAALASDGAFPPANAGGALLRLRRLEDCDWLAVGPEPPRRNSRPAEPDWDLAGALLADPALR